MKEDNYDDNYDDEQDYIDIEATVKALQEAWRLMPDVSLSQLLDTVTTMPFCEMKNSELIDELNHFVHQNQ